MKSRASIKADQAISKLKAYYKTDISGIIGVIDHYINYYQETEAQKRELSGMYNNYQDGKIKIEEFLSEVEEFTEIDNRALDIVKREMHAFTILKVFIAEMSVAFAYDDIN